MKVKAALPLRCFCSPGPLSFLLRTMKSGISGPGVFARFWQGQAPRDNGHMGSERDLVDLVLSLSVVGTVSRRRWGGSNGIKSRFSFPGSVSEDTHVIYCPRST